MSKNKTSKKATPPKPPKRSADPDADLDNWRQTMLDAYLPDVGSEAERRRVNMHINMTHHLARELRALRRAIEARGGGK